MRLILARTTVPKPKDPFIKKAAFIVFPRVGREGDLKKLGTASYKLYPFVTESGIFGSTAVISKTPPEVTDDSSLFGQTSEFSLTMDTDPNPREENKRTLVKETRKVKGSRVKPTYMAVDKVQDLGDGSWFVEGKLYGARDPRLEFLDPEEETSFGSGEFDPEKVKGHYDGDYVYLNLSPWASDIKNLAEEQKRLFETLVDNPNRTDIKDKIERTRRLLKPHTYEIYDYKDGHVFYINGLGNWECVTYSGLRDIDVYDRARIRKWLQDNSLEKADLRASREEMYLNPERFDISNISHCFQHEVTRRAQKDEKELEEIQNQNLKRKPTEGPLGPKDLPGLKPGIKLFPHQAYILGSLRHSSRQLIDADPGAGKTLLIICDILQQMQMKKVRRPLVLMPEYLLAQFAQEVRTFSELNPWIINTESVKRWSKGEGEGLEEFIESAKNAPPNTVFLTSYNWLGRDKREIPNGEISTKEDGSFSYNKSIVYERPVILTEELEIDALYMDEAHVLKSASNQVQATIALGNVPIVRGLTGTIMPGNLIDVTGAMGVIHSGVFGSSDEFLNEYSEDGSPTLYKEDAPKKIRMKLAGYGTPQTRRSAWQHLLPHSKEQFHYVEFTPTQQKAYDSILNNVLDEIKNDPILSRQLEKLERELQEHGGEGEQLEASGPMLTRFVPIEVFLNNPKGATDITKVVLEGDDAKSPKAKIISEICRKHLSNPNNGKILVFVQFKNSALGILDSLDDDLKDKAAYYEGGMVDVLNRLKNPDDPLKILIGVDVSLRVGHNIQSVNCIIHGDLLWMNGDMSQREARSLRIGQKRDVDIHYIITKGSAEVLKMARLISAEHMVAKANSNFDETETLQPVQMKLESMRTFRQKEQLEPFINRKIEIKKQYLVQAEHDKKFFGSHLLEPKSSGVGIDETFGDEAKILRAVPSAKTFVGDTTNVELLIEKQVEKLPTNPPQPKVLELHMKKIDEDWHVVCYYSTDPGGWLRKFGFQLSRTLWFLEVGSKEGAKAEIKKIKDRGFDIVDEKELEQEIKDTRVTAPGKKNVIVMEERKSRARTQQAKQKAKRKKSVAMWEVDGATRGEIKLQFGLFDGTPLLWVDTLEEDATELGALKSMGFKSEPSFWYLEVTRSSIVKFFTRLHQQHSGIEFTNWEKFRQSVMNAFKGLDLDASFADLDANEKQAKKENVVDFTHKSTKEEDAIKTPDYKEAG